MTQIQDGVNITLAVSDMSVTRIFPKAAFDINPVYQLITHLLK